jgi:hypothetical protein
MPDFALGPQADIAPHNVSTLTGFRHGTMSEYPASGLRGRGTSGFVGAIQGRDRQTASRPPLATVPTSRAQLLLY